MKALGAVIGALALLLVYIGYMFLYIKARRKFSGTKYAVEVVAILIAFLFSFGVKYAIFAANRPDTFEGGLATVFYSIYSGIGGLEFEGLMDPGEVSTELLQWLYSGSSLLAGLVFFSIILTKISYEMYSWVLLLFLRVALKFKSNIDVYLFTSVTQDSLLLADSINEKREHYKEALKKYKKAKRDDKTAQKPEKVRNSKIIFAGDDIGSFDRKNPLHREIMSNGYMFWSYTQKTRDKSSILKRLGLYIDNVFFETAPPTKDEEKEERKQKRIVVKAKAKCSRIHIFAMHNDATLSGEETINTEIVFDEIETVAKEIVEYNKKPVFVDYYILTNSDINYKYYDQYKETCVKRGKKKGKQLAKPRKHHAKDKLKPVFENIIEVRNPRGVVNENEFALHIINESDITSKLFAKERNEWNENLLIQDTGNSTYKVMVVGFGATGQRTMLKSYVMTAKIDATQSNYHMPTQFRADVFDKNADSVCGIFELQHPLIVCVNEKDADNSNELEKLIENKRKEKIDTTYHTVVGKRMNLPYGEDREATIEDIEKQMKLPVIVMHNTSCFGSDYIRYLDSQTGADSRSQSYNLILIALGKDEDNIKIANALLADIKHELSNPRNTAKPAKLQTIAINIINKKNRARINWSDEEAKQYGNLKVIVFGSREEIYSYDSIIEEKESMKYHHAYYLLNENIIPNQSAPMERYFLNRETPPKDEDGYFELLRGFYDAVKSEDDGNLREEWKTVPLEEKESNRSASLFKPVMKAMKTLYCTDVYSYNEIRLLVELEHERWNRSYIANGWTFNHLKDKKKEGKARNEHDCLLPYSMLDEKYSVYDIVNVAGAFEKVNIDEEEKGQ